MSTDPARRIGYLEDIVERLDWTTVALEGKTFEAFDADPNVKAAVHHHLLILGEAARRIDGLAELVPDHDWRRIKQYGNVIRHDYRDVRPEVAYQLFATGELARLRTDCLAAIGRLRDELP